MWAHQSITYLLTPSGVLNITVAQARAMAREAKYKRLPMTTREVDIIRRLKKHVQLPVAKIALAVGRDKKTIYNALSSKWSMKKRGRHPKLTCKEINFIVRTAKAMIQNAKACKEVTLEMIMRRAKTKACARTVRKALQQRKIRFRKMRSKPVLTAEDVIDRKRFAAKYRHKSRAWWRSKVDLYIDLKKFPVYPTHKFRALAAQREVRGAYRQPSQGLDEAYVVVPKHLKQNPGVKGATIAGGVGKGKVRLWHDVGKKWTAAAASELYLGPVRAAMRRATPRKRKFQILEDNDPTGFRSKAGLAAKRLAKINVLQIPKRSPDLSVMDYAIWKQITRRMRLQERRFKKSKRETRAQFLARLSRTARNLDSSFIDKAIGNMKERCRRLHEAKGRHFEEGGLSLL